MILKDNFCLKKSWGFKKTLQDFDDFDDYKDYPDYFNGFNS